MRQERRNANGYPLRSVRAVVAGEVADGSASRRRTFCHLSTARADTDRHADERQPHAWHQSASLDDQQQQRQRADTHVYPRQLHGIPELRRAILEHAGGETGTSFESGFLTNARHQALVGDSLVALENAAAAVHNRVPHEMLLLDLYNALRPLDEITGATTTDDILNLIFSRFCIGK